MRGFSAPFSNQNLHFKTLTISEGLSQNSINAIIQDFKGFIWIGTQDGLNRYDGYEFRVYKNNPADPDSISDNYITAMILDSRGTIWLGTGEGLNRYEPRLERFVRYCAKTPHGNNLTDNRVTALFESPHRPGIIWIGSEQGLDRLDSSSGRFTHFRIESGDDGLSTNNHIQCLYEAPSMPGTLWIGTRNGLYRFNLDSESFDGFLSRKAGGKGPENSDIKVLYEAPSLPGTLWVGTLAGLDGMDMRKEQFFHVMDESLRAVQIRALFEPSSSSRALWIGSYGQGIFHYSLDKGKVERRIVAARDQQSLTENFILFFFEDRSRLVWIGTELGGVSQFSPLTRNFLHIRSDPEDPNSLSHRTVRAIAESRRFPGNIWIGTYGGLDLLDRESGRVRRYRHRPGRGDGPASDLIRVVFEDRRGRLWVGMHSAGMSVMQADGVNWIHHLHDPGRPGSISSNTARCMLEDREGSIWIGTVGGGLNRYNEKQNDFTSFSFHPAQKKGISSDRVYSLLEDRRGRFWVGTSEGLNLMDRARGEFKAYRNKPLDVFSLSNDMVMSLCEDSRGTIWIGTWGGGLNRFDEKSDSFDHFGEPEGLANNVVYGILEDNQGKLWLSTNNGLSRFDPLSLQFKNYNVTDGLQSNEFNANAYLRTADGTLYFGGINGINFFNPQTIRENPYQPPMVISGFQVANRSVPIRRPEEKGGILRQSIVYTDKIRLSHRDSIITFEYSALSFTAPEKNRYAYMMEGLEKDWNYVGTRRFVTYTNIPPGKYRFRVKGANHDGFWNEIGTHVDLVVEPPFWRTVWFQGLFLFLLLLLLYTLLTLRTRTLSRRKRVLEQVVRERTRELTRQNEELARLSLVAEHTDNGVLITDARGNIEWINEGFTRMYGYRYDQLLSERGRNMAIVSHREDFAEILKECTDSQKPVVYESMCLTRDGKKKWAQTVLNPILDERGEIVKLVLIDSDITLLKEATERAEQDRKAAQEANQAKSNFLARMSHEIRTPMNGVIGFTDMLLETSLTPEQRDYLHTIKSSGESLLYLINDILDFSKIETGNMAFEYVDFNLEQLVCESCEIVAPRAEYKEVELICHISDDLPVYICSDPVRLRQVLINLLDNALKFTDMGTVELAVSGSKEDDRQFRLEITVKDTGPGIASEKQKAIFNAFTQADESTSRRHGGTGLGLAICKQIARQMGGDIYLLSEPGKGSSFTFTALVEFSLRRPSPVVPEGSLDGKRALIVDDNSRNLTILAHILSQKGMEVKSINDPAVVVSELELASRDKPFDICIIDILMPALDGFSLAGNIRKLPSPLRDIPLLAYSSSISSQVSQYRHAGFNAFLTKPIQKLKLLRTVWSLIEKDESLAPMPDMMSASPESGFQPKLKVLLVEDNAINRKLVDRVLGKAGHDMTAVDNGLEAIREIERNPHGYDLIVMDIHMPVMDGFEATRRIREMGYTQIPIIALTADSMKGDREKCLAAGMNDYISKPINRNELLRILRKWSR